MESIPARDGSFAIAPADMDRDGDPDLVVSNKSAGDITVYRNDRGALHAAAVIPVGDGPTPVAVADLDRDGNPDIVTANGFSNDLSILLARPGP